MVSSMTPEDELCLLLARGQLTSEMRTRALELLSTPLRWPVVMERARSHQVFPLLYRKLNDLGFTGVPEAVQSGLKSLYLANALRNQLLAEELARVLSLLGDAGIPVIPLKGVPLAKSLFGDPAARVRRHRYYGSARRCNTGHRPDSSFGLSRRDRSSVFFETRHASWQALQCRPRRARYFLRPGSALDPRTALLEECRKHSRPLGWDDYPGLFRSVGTFIKP